MDASAWAAWYAAGVATLIGGWDIYKWASDGPKLRVSVVSDMLLVGGDAAERKFIRVSVANTGSKSTTLTTLGLFAFKNRWEKFRRRPTDAFVVNLIHFNRHELPFQLQTGVQWDGCLAQENDLVTLASKRDLYLVVHFSHSDKPLLKQIVFRGDS